MNVSDRGYAGNTSMDGKIDNKFQDVGPISQGPRSSSAGGIEDLGNWLKYESSQKYEESL